MARDMVSGEGICPCGGDQVIGRGRGGLDDVTPVVQFKVAIFFGFNFIHYIIHGATEGIQGTDCGTLFLRQQFGRKVKGFAEFGDLLFALVNYARFKDINPEEALERTNKKFFKRFQFIEEGARQSGRELTSMTLEEMDVYWNLAKASEG